MDARDDPAAFLRALGGAVRAARERVGLSQEKLSFMSELDRTYISGVERGVRNPTVKTLLRIATAMGVTVSALMRRAEGVRGG